MKERPEPSLLDHFEAEMAGVERRLAAEIDPGKKAMVIAGLLLVLMLLMAAPHAGSATGWEAFAGSDDAVSVHVALPSWIFVVLSVVGAILSVVALVVRRWGAAWLASAVTTLAAPAGLLAIWTRQTPPPGTDAAGPGLGLVLMWPLVLILAGLWVSVVWRRPSVDQVSGHPRGPESPPV